MSHCSKKIAVIVGSQRCDSQSAKIGREVKKRLPPNVEAELLDLAETPLPFWDGSVAELERQQLESIGEWLSDCDGFVVISPEWHGMVPAALKNFFLHYSSAQFAHKPALIVSVSAGESGSYPVIELRASSYKNSRICYLPEHLIIRQVESVFNHQESENDPRLQAYLSDRMDYALGVLVAYADGMKGVRDNLPDGSAFRNGM